MRWEDVLPPQIAKQQTQWEKDMSLLRAIESSATLRTIGKRLGVGPGRIRQRITGLHRLSPLERWLEAKQNKFDHRVRDKAGDDWMDGWLFRAMTDDPRLRARIDEAEIEKREESERYVKMREAEARASQSQFDLERERAARQAVSQQLEHKRIDLEREKAMTVRALVINGWKKEEIEALMSDWSNAVVKA